MQGFSGKKVWKFKQNSNKSIDSSWIEDKKNGTFIYRDIDGKPLYEATYDNNVLYGEVKAFKDTGDINSSYKSQYNGLHSATHFFNQKKIADFNLTSKIYVANKDQELPAVGEYIHIKPQDGVHPAEKFPGTVWDLVSSDFILTSDKAMYNLAELPNLKFTIENKNETDINASPFTLKIQTTKPIEAKYKDLYRAVVYGYGNSDDGKTYYKRRIIPLDDTGTAIINDVRIFFPTLITPGVRYSIAGWLISPYSRSDETRTPANFNKLLALVNTNSEIYFEKFNWGKVPNPFIEEQTIVHDKANAMFGKREMVYLWKRKEDHMGIGPYLYTKDFKEYDKEKLSRSGSYVVNVNEYDDPYCALDGEDVIYNPDAIHPMVKRTYKAGVLNNKIELYNEAGDLYNEVLLDEDKNIKAGRLSNFTPDGWDMPNDRLVYKQNVQKTSLIPAFEPYVDLEEGNFTTIKPSKFDAPLHGSGTIANVQGVEDMYDNLHLRNIHGIPDKNITVRIHWGHDSTPQQRDFYTTTVISNKDPEYFLPYRTFAPYPLIEKIYRTQIHDNKKQVAEFKTLPADLDLILMLKSVDAVVDRETGHFINNLYPGSKWKYGVNTSFGNLIEGESIDIYPRFYIDKVNVQNIPENFVEPEKTEEGRVLFDIGVSYNALNNTASDVLPKSPVNLSYEVRGIDVGNFSNEYVDRALRTVRIGALLESFHSKMGTVYANQYHGIRGLNRDLRAKILNTNTITKYIPYVYMYISYNANGRKVEMETHKITENPFTAVLTEMEFNNLLNYNGTIHIIPMWKDPEAAATTNPYASNDSINISIDWGYDDNNNRLKTIKNVNLHEMWEDLHNTTDLSIRIPDYTKIGTRKLRNFFYRLNTIQPTDASLNADQLLLDEIAQTLINVDKNNYTSSNTSSVYDANKRPDDYVGSDRSRFFMRRNYMFISDNNKYLNNYRYNNDIVFNIDVDKILERPDRTFNIYALSTKPYIGNFHWNKKVLNNGKWDVVDQISTVKGLQLDERVTNDPTIRNIMTAIATRLKTESHPDYKYFTSRYAYYKSLGSDIAAAINKTIPKSAINHENAVSADAFIFSDHMDNYQVMNDKEVYDTSSAKQTWYNICKYLSLYRNKQLTYASKVVFNPDMQVANLSPDFYDLSHNVDPNILFTGVNHVFDLYLNIPTPDDMRNINPYSDNDMVYIKWSNVDSNDNAIVKISMRSLWDFAYQSNQIRPKQKLKEAFPEGITIDIASRLKEWVLKNPEAIRSIMTKFIGNPNNYLKWLRDNAPDIYTSYFNVLDEDGTTYLNSIPAIDNSLIGTNIWNTFRYLSNKQIRFKTSNKYVDFVYVKDKAYPNEDRAFLKLPIRMNLDDYIENYPDTPMTLENNFIVPSVKTLAVDIPNTSWVYTETAPPTGNGRLLMSNFYVLSPFKKSNHRDYNEIKELNKDYALRHVFDVRRNTFRADHMSYVWDPSRSFLGELATYYRNLDVGSKTFDIDRLKAIIKYPNPAIQLNETDDTMIVNVKYEVQEQIHLPDMRPMTYIIEPTDYDKIIPMIDRYNDLQNNSLLSFTEPDGTKSKLSDILVALPEAVMYEWYMWTGILSQSSDPNGYYARNNIDWFNTDALKYGSNIVEFITDKLVTLRAKHGLSTTDKFPRTIEDFMKAKFNIYIISDPIKDPPTRNTLDESYVFATKERIFTRWIHMKDNFAHMKDYAVYVAMKVSGADFLNMNNTLKIPSVSMTNRNPSNGYPAQVPMVDLFKDVDGVMRVGTRSNPVMIIELVVE